MDPLYRVFEGHILLAGYAPDGDSLRFLPRAPAELASLRNAAALTRSARDGSVQVRLEGIDAPELHYEGACQPQGARARDALLAWLGVRDVRNVPAVRYAFDGMTIVRAPSELVPVTILANDVDRHGRPIAYLLSGASRATRAHRVRKRARRMRVSTAVLRCTANFAMIQGGHAYLLAYTSLHPVHRRTLRDAARAARRAKLGVWRDDATARGFALHGGARSIGPEGALVFPKLFRRCVDYLARRHREGFGGSFVEWLARYGAGGSATPERVTLHHAANIPFASLVREHHERIALTTDLTDLVFVES